jgi:glucose-1-phosphate adenylyltransferase
MSVDEEYRITRFTEKPEEPECVPGKQDMALASMGIYIFSMEFLTSALMGDAEDEASQHDFGKNIIPAAIQSAKSVAYPYLNSRGEPDYWRDVGSIYSYWKANIELCDIEPELNLYERDWPIWTYQSQSPPAKFAFDDEGRRGQAIDSLVAGGCIISGAKVKRSVIFFNTRVETGSYVRKSVVLPKVRIGKNCLIKNCVIDKGTVIPDGFQVGVDPEEDRRRFIVTDEGIVLITPGMMNQRLHYERD